MTLGVSERGGGDDRMRHVPVRPQTHTPLCATANATARYLSIRFLCAYITVRCVLSLGGLE